MSIDACTLRELIRELSDLIIPSRVERLQQVGKQRLLISLRSRAGRFKLLLSADASESVIYLSDESWQSPERPPAFLQQLRKQLQGAELNFIRAVEDERIAVLGFTRLNDLGDPEDLRLIAELMGRHANLILCRDELILEAIKHIDSSQSRFREVMPMRTYVKPPEQNAISPQELLDRLKAGSDLMELIAAEGQTAPLDRFLVRNIAAISPLMIADALINHSLDERLDYKALDSAQKERLSSALIELCEKYLEVAQAAYLYYREAELKTPFAYHVIDFKSLPYRRKFNKLSSALKAYYSSQHAAAEIAAERSNLAKALQRIRKNTQRKLELHEKDLAASADRYDLQKRCELLQANFVRLKDLAPGSEELTVIDYWDPELAEVKVKLNPKILPTRNAEYYSKQYKKKMVKAEKAEAFLKQDQRNLIYIGELEENLARAQSLEDLDAVKEDIDHLADLAFSQKNESSPEASGSNSNKKQPDMVGKRRSKKQPQRSRKKQKTAKPKALKARRYEFDGIRIEVGRNNLQNDELSLHRAKRDSQWFHIKNRPGAHVVVHAKKSELSPELELAAAELAAWFSSANQNFGEVTAEVDRCTVGNLRKTKGLPPGQLLYSSEASYRVTSKGPEKIKGLSDLA
ncbi:MAG: NFACT family protein [Eubacteriales bacterium]|nr:NFACT family protein [Eubacteriales bacterium]